MNPNDSPQSLIPNPESLFADPRPLIPREPFFDYTDLFFFVGFCIPSIFIALLLVRAVRVFAPMPMGIQLLLIQTVWYFLVFGSLAALFRIRYDRPFWRSLGWRPHFLQRGGGRDTGWSCTSSVGRAVGFRFANSGNQSSV